MAPHARSSADHAPRHRERPEGRRTMASGIETAVIRLGEFQDGQEADCFAVLVTKEKGTTKKNEPFVKCFFRDRQLTVEAPLWSDNRFLRQSDGWAEGHRLPPPGPRRVQRPVRPPAEAHRHPAGRRPEDEADGYRVRRPGRAVEVPETATGSTRSSSSSSRYIEDPRGSPSWSAGSWTAHKAACRADAGRLAHAPQRQRGAGGAPLERHPGQHHAGRALRPLLQTS